tara:strand:+ start:556 stop:1389 length:834 start_codon:yes stop_codon:yes gene_type:complete
METTQKIRKNYINQKGQIYQEYNIDNSNYWNSLWSKYSDKEIKRLAEINKNKNDLIVKITKKYLKKNSSIIEAGCGLGQEVFKLENAGFDVTGIDYDEGLIERLNRLYPNTEFLKSDVSNLSNINQKFDGYWSFGVIEHFIDGYDEIANQANKALNDEGYSFVIVPSMNYLSSLKKMFNVYQKKEPAKNLFHQFILDIKQVRNVFEKNGFQFVEKQNMTGSLGASREISMPKIFTSRSKIKLIRGLWWMLNPFLSNFTWHTSLVVFKKISNPHSSKF